MQIEAIEAHVSKTCDEISMLEDRKTRITKRLSLLREYLSMKLSMVECQLEECLSLKTFFDSFVYSDLNAMEIACYGLRNVLNILEGVKE